jgi:hypothetical protein
MSTIWITWIATQSCRKLICARTMIICRKIRSSYYHKTQVRGGGLLPSHGGEPCGRRRWRRRRGGLKRFWQWFLLQSYVGGELQTIGFVFSMSAFAHREITIRAPFVDGFRSRRRVWCEDGRHGALEAQSEPHGVTLLSSHAMGLILGLQANLVRSKYVKPFFHKNFRIPNHKSFWIREGHSK